jgi:anti-sigma B factor antagonist
MDELTEVPRARLTVATGRDGGGLHVRLAGELDIASLPDVAPQLDALLAQDPQPVQVDLEGLEFLDSSGIAVLVRIANRFHPVGVRNATPAVRRVIEVLGLAGRLGLDRD